MYFIAFLGAYQQNEGLMGINGIQPVKASFDSIKDTYSCNNSSSSNSNISMMANCIKRFMNHPSIFWFYYIEYNDRNMKKLHLAGITMSIILILGNIIIIPHKNERRRLRRQKRDDGTIIINNAITSTTTPGSRNMIVTASSLQGLSTGMILLFGLWISYFTIVTSANSTSFYQYEWESQLLETGFLAIFLCRNCWPKVLLHIY